MTYEETLNYLYDQRPAFERQGAQGYKPGLQTAIDLDNLCHNPHRLYPIIHVAGTNGKGSVSNMLAAILQNNGYRVGLFTSPHFVDFRERIRVNGKMISKDYVVKFVEETRQWDYAGEPSFFELTSAMAFQYFADQKVDVAIIEVGLGGRLDSTNIITPILSIITNISIDHTEFLGNTLEQIASEKADIIKPAVPAIVGEAQGSVRQVFEHTAQDCGAPITFVSDDDPVAEAWHDGPHLMFITRRHGTLACELTGDYQRANVATVLTAVDALIAQGYTISDELMAQALVHIHDLTGLRGRWTVIAHSPTVIADSAHNIAGITAVTTQLANYSYNRLHMVVGFMADKDLQHILPLLPHDATYYFTEAHTPRALKAEALQTMAATHGLQGERFNSIGEAYGAAKAAARHSDLIYVGGSMYVLAEFFEMIDNHTI